MLETKRFTEIVSYRDTSSDDTLSYRGASIAIPHDTPKSTVSKENDSFNILQDHFYNE